VQYEQGLEMALDDLRKELEQHFDGLWIPADAEVEYGSEPLGSVPKDQIFPMVRVLVQSGLSVNTGVRGCVDRTGFISVFIYTKYDAGAGIAWRLSDKVLNIFENKRIGNIVTFETSVYDRGRLSDAGIRIFEASTSYEAKY